MRVPIISKIDGFVRQCESLSLAFDWSVSGSPNDVVCERLHSALIEHFAANGLVFAIPGPGAVSKDMVPWVMYMSSQSA
jgi:hypothetical protein